VLYMASGELVTVEACHAEVEPPYYTVRFADGREKQTEGALLTMPHPSTDEPTARQGLRYEWLANSPGAQLLPPMGPMGPMGPTQHAEQRDGLHRRVERPADDDDEGHDDELRAQVQGRDAALRTIQSSWRYLKWHPITSLCLTAIFTSSFVVVMRPQAKSVLCLHWPSIIGRAEYYRCITCFFCSGRDAFSVAAMLDAYILSTTIAAHELQSSFSGRSRWFLAQIVFGMLGLLCTQYHRVWVASRVESYCGVRIAQWLPAHFWLFGDLVFYMLCCASFERPSEIVQLSIGLPIAPMARWMLPFAMSAMHLMTSGTMAGVHIEAILVGIVCCIGAEGISQIHRAVTSPTLPQRLHINTG